MNLAILNQKGGVGKTTSAVAIGHGLARRGYRTLLVDLDSQGHIAEALGLDKGPDLYDLLINDLDYAHTATGRQNLDAVLSDKTTIEAREIISSRPGRELHLKRALDRVQQMYEFDAMVLDIAPGADLFHVSAFVAATHFLIPVQLAHLAATGAAEELATVASLYELGFSDATFIGVLPTFWDRRTNECHEQLQLLIDEYAERVWPPIPVDTKAAEAPAYGQTLWEYGAERACRGVEIDGRYIGGYTQVLDRLEAEVLQ